MVFPSFGRASKTTCFQRFSADFGGFRNNGKAATVLQSQQGLRDSESIFWK
jgi:hypothetical protein